MTEITAYQFNHPKNYLGYAVALAHSSDKNNADNLVEEYVVGTPDQARRGAQNLGLVEKNRNGRQYDYSLTDRGRWVCAEMRDRMGADSLVDVLQTFDDLRGSRKRFVDKYPELREIGADIARGDPTIVKLIDELETIHGVRVNTGRDYALTIHELYFTIGDRGYHDFARDLFVRDDEEIRRNYSHTDLASGFLDGKSVYRSPTTYQLKNLLWHLGVLQSKGTQATDIEPTEETWALEKDVLGADPLFQPSATTDGGVA